MRAILSIISLIITCGIVFWLVKGQLVGSPTTSGAGSITSPMQSNETKEQVTKDIKKALDEQAKKVQDADNPPEKSGAY